MTTPNLSEIITTTLRNRSGKLADNVSKGNPLLMRLKEKGAWKQASGRTIIQEMDYAENGNFMYYSGGEQLNIASSDVMTGAEFDWKQAACAVVATGLEVDVQNTGKEAIIDLLESRIKNAVFHVARHLLRADQHQPMPVARTELSEHAQLLRGADVFGARVPVTNERGR